MVGNDIVDLQFFEAPPYRHVGYLDRICQPGEAESVRQSECAPRSLAAVWACKEAAFKLISRDSKQPHFVPREFVTDFGAFGFTALDRNRSVLHGKTRVSVELFLGAQWIHAVATFPGQVARWRVAPIGHGPGSPASPRAESEAARRLARELCLECGFESLKEAQETGRAPFGRMHAARGDVAISLSHHGGFAAAAVAWTSGQVVQDARSDPRERCSTCTA